MGFIYYTTQIDKPKAPHEILQPVHGSHTKLPLPFLKKNGIN